MYTLYLITIVYKLDDWLTHFLTGWAKGLRLIYQVNHMCSMTNQSACYYHIEPPSRDLLL